MGGSHAAALLVIHGVAAGMRRESVATEIMGVWDVRPVYWWREVGAAGGAMGGAVAEYLP